MFKSANELSAYDFAFLLRVINPGKRCQELIGSIHRDQSHARGGHKILFHLCSLALTEQTMVDKDAHQLVTHSLMHQCCGHGRIDPARKTANHEVFADLIADALYLSRNDISAIPVITKARNIVEKTLQDSLAVVRMAHFWMPLHAKHAPLHRAKGSDRRGGGRSQHFKAWRSRNDLVTMGHPGVLLRGLPGKERTRGRIHRRCGGAILSQPCFADFAAEFSRHRLEAITNSEDGNPHLEYARGKRGGSLVVHTGWPTAEHNGHWLLCL